jgi:hypothetical protein
MQIELAKTVAARPATAFSILANVVDWPEIISSIRSIEVLTLGPIQTGTRLREDRIMFGAEVTPEVEIATIERPHRCVCWWTIPICTTSSITWSTRYTAAAAV